jgi:hypothetical protein
VVLSRVPRLAGMNSAHSWHTMVVLEHGFEFDLGVSLGNFLEARLSFLISQKPTSGPPTCGLLIPGQSEPRADGKANLPDEQILCLTLSDDDRPAALVTHLLAHSSDCCGEHSQLESKSRTS